MKKLLLICAIIISLTANSQQVTTDIGIIPTPQNVEIYDSTNYYILDKSCVLVDNKNEEVSKIINTFKNDIKDITSLDLDISKKKKKTKKTKLGIYYYLVQQDF